MSTPVAPWTPGPAGPDPVRPTRRRRLRRWLVVSLLALSSLVLLGLAGLLVVYATTTVPTPNKLAVRQTSAVTYLNGREFARFGTQNRTSVPLSAVPLAVRQAVLAAEDRRFYSEPGVSPRGIARAIYADIRGGAVAQGGSTITQQYAKNYYLTQDRTVSRKAREIFIAVKLGRTRSKDSILADYLNTIYFGRGAYGIQAAAQTYFGVPVGRITVPQAAVLAAIVRAPALYDPATHPAAAQARWRYVISGMTSQGWLAPDAAAKLRYPKVGTARARSAYAGPNGYLVAAVRSELTRRGISQERVDLGGLHVTTTISRKAQRAAVAAERSVLATHKGPVSALVAVVPGDGAIRAMYGGRDYTGTSRTAQLNLATQIRRQPGSSFKPYTLAAALSRGIGLRTYFDGSSPKYVPGYGKDNEVRNDSNEQCPRCDLVTATEESINTVYVPLAVQVGPRDVAAMAHAAGIPASVPLHDAAGYTGPAITLGVYGVRPLDQAVGFATFAAKGVAAAPYLVSKVTDSSGKVLFAAKPSRSRAFSAGVAADATYAMQQVVTGSSGTGQRAQLHDGRPVAGKTGTTQNNTDAWFVGFTPQLSAAVWMGNVDNSPLTNVSGYSGGVYGGTLPAEIWKKFMDATLAGTPVRQFPPPAYVGGTDSGIPSAAPPLSSAAPSSASPTPSSATPSASVSSPAPSPSSAPPSSAGPVSPSVGPMPSPTRTRRPHGSSSPSPGSG